MSLQGIDVSQLQGNVDWGSVKKSGIQFAMLRAGYGKGIIDLQFRKNASQCNQLKIPFGVYWLSYAYNEEMAEQEAKYCIQTIEEFKVQYPVCFTFAYDSARYAEDRGASVNRQLVSSLVEAFCDEITMSGYFPMFYSNLDYLSRMFNVTVQNRYSLWFAQYTSAPSEGRTVMWQYTRAGRVPGIKGEVNRNITYEDLASIISKSGLNCLKKVMKTPEPQTAYPVDDIVYIVQERDNLERIAARYGVKAEQLSDYNGIADDNLLYPGQLIRVPIGTGEAASIYYTVREGDTLNQIAADFYISESELCRINKLKTQDILLARTVIQIR